MNSPGWGALFGAFVPEFAIDMWIEVSEPGWNPVRVATKGHANVADWGWNDGTPCVSCACGSDLSGAGRLVQGCRRQWQGGPGFSVTAGLAEGLSRSIAGVSRQREASALLGTPAAIPRTCSPDSEKPTGRLVVLHRIGGALLRGSGGDTPLVW